MPSLTWDHVLTWRLSRQYLLDRAERADMLAVVRRLGGVQAQVMSAAEMQLAARVDDLTPDDVRNALWRNRTLLKTWLLRGTLHLLAADELPLYSAAITRAIGPFYRRASWLRYHGVTLEELDALVAGVRAALGAEPMTREQLASAVEARMNAPHLGQRLRSGWGMLLKPAAQVGALCFGPSQGQNVTFVAPDQWIGPQPPIDGDDALQAVALRFLDGYGPATAEAYGRWLGLDEAKAKKVFRALGGQIAEVEIDGWRGWLPSASLDALAATEPRHSVRLVPGFDPYILGAGRFSEQIVTAEHKPRVWRPQGWISPCVLVDGRVAGVWSIQRGKTGASIELDLFAPVSKSVTRGIEAEVERMTAFLNSGALADDSDEDAEE